MLKSHRFLIASASLFVLVGLSASSVRSSDPGVRDATLKAGEELTVDIDCETYQEVVISVQNRGSGTCICWYTGLRDGEELSDEVIGPLSERTMNIQKNYKKVKGIDCVMDQVQLHMEEGEAEIRVSQVSYD